MFKNVKKITQYIIIALCVAINSQPAHGAENIKKRVTEAKESIQDELDQKLIKAVKDGSIAWTRAYLTMGANPEAADAAGLNALHYAQDKRVQANIYKKEEQFKKYENILQRLEAAQMANLKKRASAQR